MNNTTQIQQAFAIATHQNFTAFEPIEMDASIRKHFVDVDRAGIYIYEFANLDYYIGKSVDIARRYKEHSLRFNDFTKVAYKLVPLEQQKDFEKRIINAFEEAGIYTRNKALTWLPSDKTNLNELWPIVEQEAWVETYKMLPSKLKIYDNEKQQQKQREKFEKFMKLPAAQEIIEFLRDYVKYCIPEPFLTEFMLWQLSCMQRGGDPGVTVPARINIFQEEVMSIYLLPGGAIQVTFQIAKSKLKVKGESRWSYLKRRLGLMFRGILLQKNLYPEVGIDQSRLVTPSIKVAREIIADPVFQKAIKFNNLRLVNKGKGPNMISHCMDLADALMEV